MEITKEILSLTVKNNRGVFSVFRVTRGKLVSIYDSPEVLKSVYHSNCEKDAEYRNDAFTMVIESDRPRVAAAISELLCGDKSAAGVNYRVLTEGGGTAWMRANINLEGTMDGDPVITVFFSNISNDLSVLDNAIFDIYVIDRYTHELFYANNNAVVHAGGESYVGRTCYSYVHGLSAPCPQCVLKSMSGGAGKKEQCYFENADKWFSMTCRETSWLGQPSVAIYGVDITDKVKKRMDLELDKESLETILKNIPVGVGVSIVNGNKVVSNVTNPQMARLFGIPHSNVSPSDHVTILQRIHKSDLEMVKSEQHRLVNPGACVSYSFRYMVEGGTRMRWYTANAHSLAQPDGSVAIYASLIDITSSKEAEAEIARSRKMYEAAAELAGLGIWIYDVKSHRITLSDSKATRKLREQFSLPKVIENVPFGEKELIDERDYKKYCDIYAAIDGGAQSATCEYWYKNAPGTPPRCERILYTTVFGSDGEPVFAYGIGQDITVQKLAEEKYDHSIKELIEADPLASWTVRIDLTGGACDCVCCSFPGSDSWAGLKTADEFFGDMAGRISDSAIREQFAASVDRQKLIDCLWQRADHLSFEYPVTGEGGCTFWESIYIKLMANPHTSAVECIIYARDITKEREQKLLESILVGAEYDSIGLIRVKTGTFELHTFAMGDPNAVLGASSNYEEGCRAAARLYVAPDDRETFLTNASIPRITRMLRHNKSYFFTIYNLVGDAKQAKKFTYYYLDESRDTILATMEDVTGVMERDALTGIYNRAGFMRRAGRIISRSRDSECFAVLFFNIRGFKAINELFGASGGDRVLRQSALALRDSSLRPLVVARMEADHFVCLVRRENLDLDVLSCLSRRTYEQNGKQFSFYWRCGIYFTDDKSVSVSSMCDRAKIAKEQIRDDFTKPYAIFDESMQKMFLVKKELTSELSGAISSRQFLVYYQPVFCAKTGALASAEALVRWVHPTLGMISPSLFIPVFEENGYISKLDLFVEKSVMAFQQRRVSGGGSFVPVSINLSRMDFYDNNMISELLDDLKNARLPGGLSRIEVTESAFASLREMGVGVLSSIRSHDAAILMDDFGSGYSSFGTMLDFDIIKLDMSFVKQIGKSDKADGIIRAMIAMAHSFGAEVIGEGAETSEQVEFLKKEGCDYIQGFYFSRPLPEAEFAELLDSQK